MAFIYKYQDGDIFARSVPLLDFVVVRPFMDLLPAESGVFITGMNVVHQEMVQPIVTFNDAIQFLYFGPGLGNISIQGFILVHQRGIYEFIFQLLKNIQGKEVDVMIGRYVLSMVLQSFQLNLIQDPIPDITFTLQFTITKSSLHYRQQIPFQCNQPTLLTIQSI